MTSRNIYNKYNINTMFLLDFQEDVLFLIGEDIKERNRKEQRKENKDFILTLLRTVLDIYYIQINSFLKILIKCLIKTFVIIF